MDDLDHALLVAMRELPPDEFEASLGRLRGLYWSRNDEADLQARLTALRKRVRADGATASPARDRVAQSAR